MDGELTWTTITIANEVGRVIVKPIYVQTHRPFPRNVCSLALQHAMARWLDYLTMSLSFFRSREKFANAEHFGMV